MVQGGLSRVILGWSYYSHVFPSLSSSTRGWTIEPDVDSVHRFTMAIRVVRVRHLISLGIHVCLGMEIIIVLFFILLERLNELVHVKHLDQFLAQWKATVDFIFVFISNEHSLSDYLNKTFVEVDRGEAF